MTLSKTLISSLGRSVVNVNLQGHCSADPNNDIPSLGHLPSWFVDKIRLLNAEWPLPALRRSLRGLIHEWKEGERMVEEAVDLKSAHSHFSNVKEMVCLINRDGYWWQVQIPEMSQNLANAYKWACYRIATLPITNEAQLMQVVAPIATAGTNLEAQWSRVHLTNPNPGRGAIGLVEQEWRARGHLRLAELGFILGRPLYDIAKHFVQATYFLAPTNTVGGVNNTDAGPEVVLWVAQFLWGRDAVPAPSQADINLLAGDNQDEAFWRRSWDRMKGGTEDNIPLDRACFLEKWMKVKDLLAERFGRVAKCKLDPEMLLRDSGR